MHSIHLCVPTLFDPGSSPGERAEVRAALDRCLGKLKEDAPKSRLFDAGDNCVAFLLPRAFHTGSNLVENARALRALLDCLTEVDIAYLRHRVPGTVPHLYATPVRYDRTVVWDSTPALYLRRFGDCKSLSATRVAELRAAGIPAQSVFRFMPPHMTEDRQFQYHILVQVPDGYIRGGWDDPSKVKGMGQDEWAHFNLTPAKAA